MTSPSTTSPAPLPSTTAINLRRLIVLRNIVLAGQALAVWVAVFHLGMDLPRRPLVAVIAAMTLLNLVTWARMRLTWPVREAELFAQLLLDVAALTALLYFTGGSTNPFAPIYLLPLTLTAAALPGAYAWAIAAVTVTCYSLLLFVYVPLPPAASVHADDFSRHALGMWVGFVLSAGLIAYFAMKMANTLRERDQLLAQQREQELRHERILALGTLAAGAAHELGTPLSTMAVLIKDLGQEAVPREKLGILRAQIKRCKEILSTLSAAAGQARAEGGRRLPVDEYLDEIMESWRVVRPSVNCRCRYEGTRPGPEILTEQTLGQAIMNILNNAADASPNDVEVNARWDGRELLLEVCDRGAGLTPAVAANAGREPFFTTKGPGEGLGLGLYLSRATVQRLGGTVQLRDREGGGACCRLVLPLAPLLVSSAT